MCFNKTFPASELESHPCCSGELRDFSIRSNRGRGLKRSQSPFENVAAVFTRLGHESQADLIRLGSAEVCYLLPVHSEMDRLQYNETNANFHRHSQI